MEERLIALKTAKLAKEKGFEALLTTAYTEKGVLYNDGEIKLSKGHQSVGSPYGQYTVDDIHVSYFQMDNSTDDFILAPTQSLLQKWLREKHNIHINIIAFDDYELNQILWHEEVIIMNKTIIDVDDEWITLCGSEFYHSYEENLEYALVEALNNIK